MQKKSSEVQKGPEWISPKEAVLRISLASGGDPKAMRLIATGLISGCLTAQARWILEEPARSPVDYEPPRPSQIKPENGLRRLDLDGKPRLLPPRFWRELASDTRIGELQDQSDDGWERDLLKEWNWERAVFVVPAPSLVSSRVRGFGIPATFRTKRRHIAYGIELRLDQVLALPQSAQSNPVPAESNKGGAERGENWADWTAELVAYAMSKDWDPAISSGIIATTLNNRLVKREKKRVDNRAAKTIIERVIGFPDGMAPNPQKT